MENLKCKESGECFAKIGNACSILTDTTFKNGCPFKKEVRSDPKEEPVYCQHCGHRVYGVIKKAAR